jgi:hypothetical protein
MQFPVTVSLLTDVRPKAEAHQPPAQPSVVQQLLVKSTPRALDATCSIYGVSGLQARFAEVMKKCSSL